MGKKMPQPEQLAKKHLFVGSETNKSYSP